MHIAIAFVALWLIAAASQASAQPYPGVGTGPKLGELEIKAYQKIPKDKVAVQLTADNHLARELRRQVMVRLSKRGNEVGFSGGNVMRMDVSYFDLLGGNDRSTGTIGGWPDYVPPGSNPRPALPANPVGRRDGLTPSTVGPTLRITLTLYSRDGGKVLWTASGSCMTQAERSQQAGEAIINRIFDSADKNAVGDAGCPL
jgi:hypothetical protein